MEKTINLSSAVKVQDVVDAIDDIPTLMKKISKVPAASGRFKGIGYPFN
jgi:hypothetical protein